MTRRERIIRRQKLARPALITFYPYQTGVPTLRHVHVPQPVPATAEDILAAIDRDIRLDYLTRRGPLERFYDWLRS